MLDDRDYMREESRRYGPQWTLTLTLIAINVVVYVIQNAIIAADPGFMDKYFALSVDGLKHGYLWQLITFQFLHSPLNAPGGTGVFHILGNMFVIYVFGRPVEGAVGRSAYLKLYLLSGTMGGLLQMFGGFLLPHHFGQAVVGASAGGMGLVAAFATLFPDQPLYLFFLPFSLRARMLLWLEIVIAVVGMISPPQYAGGVAHCAHLGGVLTGIFYIRLISFAQTPLAFWQSFRFKPRRRELVKAGSNRPEIWRRPDAAKQEELPPAEFMAQEVDPILDKISAHGIQSLTERERQILQAARSKMSKR
jgi:membrane associated rhomboid family serine protease